MFWNWTIFLLTCTAFVSARRDGIIYKVDTQAKCTEVTRGPTRDCRWPAGLDMVDQMVEKGRILAYKIRWFNGSWSGWYGPGLNDLSNVFNIYAKTCSIPYRAKSMRRRWAMFYVRGAEWDSCGFVLKI